MIRITWGVADMENKNLGEYIKTEISKGVSIEKIKQRLSESGFLENEIDRIINSIGGTSVTSRAETIAKLTKTGSTVSSSYGIVRALPFTIIAILLGIFLLYMHVAWYIGALCIFFGVLWMTVQIVRTKRIASVDISSHPLEVKENPKAEIDKDEKVKDYIAGIMRTDFKVRSYEVLGAGSVIMSENAMIITDRHILMITVPLPGAEKVVDGTDLSMWQWLAAKKDIESKLKEMISDMPVNEIAQTNPKNYALELTDIKKVGTPRFQQTLAFTTMDNKKYSYSIRDKADYEKAKSIFASYL
jgi:hypothetical protein